MTPGVPGTVVVFNSRGVHLDGLYEFEDRAPLLAPNLTQAILTSGGPNTAGTVRMTVTITVAPNGKHSSVVGGKGV